MDQDGTGKALVSLRNVAAERYWGTRWKREWQAKYHDPLVVSFFCRHREKVASLSALCSFYHIYMMIPSWWYMYIPVTPRLCRFAQVKCRGNERRLTLFNPPKSRERMQYVSV